jgi:hypothetical protein
VFRLKANSLLIKIQSAFASGSSRAIAPETHQAFDWYCFKKTTEISRIIKTQGICIFFAVDAE